jgi:hypothetical protein
MQSSHKLTVVHSGAGREFRATAGGAADGKPFWSDRSAGTCHQNRLFHVAFGRKLRSQC